MTKKKSCQIFELTFSIKAQKIFYPSLSLSQWKYMDIDIYIYIYIYRERERERERERDLPENFGLDTKS